MEEKEETPAAPGEGAHAAKAKRSRRKPKTQVAIDSADADSTPPAGTPPDEIAQPSQSSSNFTDPRGIHNIDLGDGR